MQRSCFAVLAASAMSLGACGDVRPMAAPDAGAGGDAAATGDAAPDPCAPDTCLLFDDFTGASLDSSKWGMTVTSGATVSQSGGSLAIRLPAVAGASADVYSLIGFPVGTSLEAHVAITGGQVYDHKAIGFSSGPVSDQCNVGETDAAIFRGQDGDGYIETKVANTYSCVNATPMYAGGTSKFQITRATDQVVFHQDDVMVGTMTANLPTGLLPVRFSAYTFSVAPNTPIEIDVDYVFVKRP